MTNGNCCNHCFQSPGKIQKGVAHQQTTGKFWKAYYGSCARARDGRICPNDIQALRPVGGGCGFGRTRASGLMYGVNSSPCLMRKGCWIGKRPLLTVASRRQKRGRVRWKNQKGQGHKVDGGGRRPRYSSGKHPCLGIALGVQARRRNARDGKSTASRPWPP